MATEFMRMGYPVFTEMGDLSRIDQVVELPDGRLVKVQVKCVKSKHGAARLERRKSGPGYAFRYEPGDVDVFAVYVYDQDVLFFVPARLLCSVRTQLSFRLRPARNGQEGGVRYASDFRSSDEAVRIQMPL